MINMEFLRMRQSRVSTGFSRVLLLALTPLVKQDLLSALPPAIFASAITATAALHRLAEKQHPVRNGTAKIVPT